MTDVLSEITDAMRKALKAQQSGSDITDAVVKVASDFGLSLDKAKRVTEGVNTLNMLELLKSGKDRTAEFSIADSREVARRLISHEKKAYAFEEDLAEEYLIPDVPQFIPHQDRLLLKKAAAILSAPAQDSPYTKDPRMVGSQASEQISIMEKKAQALESEAWESKNNILRGLTKLASLLTSAYHIPLNQFGKEAEAVYGPTAVPYLHLLGKMIPAKLHGELALVKVAKLVETRTPAHNAFQEVMKSADTFATKMAAAAHMGHEADAWKTKLGALMEKSAVSAEPPKGFWEGRRDKRDAKIKKKYEREKSDYERKEFYNKRKEFYDKRDAERPGKLEGALGLNFAQNQLGNLASKLEDWGGEGGFTGALKAVAPGRDLEELADSPQRSYYDRLRNSLKLQATIQHVIDNDPVLRHRDPEKLLPIIQTLVTAAPQLSSQPAILASILGHASSGHHETLDPLTLEMYAKADYSLLKNRAARQAQATGGDKAEKWRW